MGMKNTVRYLSQAEKPISQVFDTGRRGNPLPGCDCVQCFGYCSVNYEVAEREKAEKRETPVVAE
jgi:hypothetical protein